MFMFFTTNEANEALPNVIEKFEYALAKKNDITKLEQELQLSLSTTDSFEEYVTLKQKLNSTIKELEQSESFKIKCRSLKSSILTSKSGIICEFKRRSPSKDIINNHSKLTDVVAGYEQAGASGISILTNEKYFSGSTNDIKKTLKIISTPILRKEFIIDEYQIIE